MHHLRSFSAAATVPTAVDGVAIESPDEAVAQEGFLSEGIIASWDNLTGLVTVFETVLQTVESTTGMSWWLAISTTAVLVRVRNSLPPFRLNLIEIVPRR